MGKKYEFRIPSPGGLNAKPSQAKLKERPLISQPPTDKNQLAPDNSYPVRQHARMAGVC